MSELPKKFVTSVPTTHCRSWREAKETVLILKQLPFHDSFILETTEKKRDKGICELYTALASNAAWRGMYKNTLERLLRQVFSNGLLKVTFCANIRTTHWKNTFASFWKKELEQSVLNQVLRSCQPCQIARTTARCARTRSLPYTYSSSCLLRIRVRSPWNVRTPHHVCVTGLATQNSHTL